MVQARENGGLDCTPGFPSLGTPTPGAGQSLVVAAGLHTAGHSAASQQRTAGVPKSPLWTAGPRRKARTAPQHALWGEGGARTLLMS